MSKESHSFSVDVAEKIGMKEALILQHFLYLQKATIEKGEDWRQKWIRKSNAALLTVYTYMTPREIRGAIERLLREGLVHCKVDNEDPKDRTKSYLLSEQGRSLFFDESDAFPFVKRANDKHLSKGQIKKSYNSCNSINDKSFTEIPGDKKSPGVSVKSSWSKEVATLFDRVSEEEHKNAKVEHEPLNWIAGAGRQFNALKMLKKSLISDIERKQQRQATEEELMSSFEYLFRYAFRYLAKISHDRGGAIQFTPAIILNNYNNALQYARQEHRTSKSTGDASRRDAFQKIIESAYQSDIE